MRKYYYFPGNDGKNCDFNGEYLDHNGQIIECRCDECDYMICCLDGACKHCKYKNCPRKQFYKKRNAIRIKKLKIFLTRLLYFFGDRNVKRCIAERYKRF